MPRRQVDGVTIKRPLDERRRRVARVTAGAMAAVIAIATLMPSRTEYTSPGLWCLFCGDAVGVDIILNIGLFVPFGVALVAAGMRPRTAILCACACSLAIEVLQVAVVTGRDSSVRDLLTNSLGGAIGAVLAGAARTLLRPQPRAARLIAAIWALGIVAVQGVGELSFVPAPTHLPYIGQVGRALRGLPPYPGRILSATLEGDRIANTMFRDSGVAAARLARRDGSPVAVNVVPLRHPDWVASIVRIIGFQRDEVLVVAQDDDGIVFGVRTHSAFFRLRPIRARLAGVFSGDAVTGQLQADTIRIEAIQSAKHTEVRALNRDGVNVLRSLLTPGHAWRISAPWQTYITGTWRDAVAGALWLAVLFAPLGYWLARTSAGNRDRAAWRPRAIGLVIVALVVYGLPWAAGTSLGAWHEAAGAIIGLATGAAPYARRIAR